MEQSHDSDLWIAEFLAQIIAVDASHFPRRYKPVIRAAPRVGDVYWCAFNDRRDIALPEMWKTRPCVIVSRRNTLHGKVTVLPFSTARSNETDPMAIETSRPVQERLDGRRSWILCDHPCTVATSRLRQLNRGFLKLHNAELQRVLTKMTSSLAAARSETP